MEVAGVGGPVGVVGDALVGFFVLGCCCEFWGRLVVFQDLGTVYCMSSLDLGGSVDGEGIEEGD